MSSPDQDKEKKHKPPGPGQRKNRRRGIRLRYGTSRKLKLRDIRIEGKRIAYDSHNGASDMPGNEINVYILDNFILSVNFFR